MVQVTGQWEVSHHDNGPTRTEPRGCHEVDAASEGRQLRKAGCKSVYLAENGKLVIQSDLVDEATKANLLNLLAGEGAVEIDVDIVRAALAALE